MVLPRLTEVVRWPAFAAALIAVLAVFLVGGCSRRSGYSQDTPDDTVHTAVAMVKNGDARRLSQLIYAEDDRMRAVLNRLGIVLGHMQELAGAIQQKFPGEVADLKRKAEDAAASGAAGPAGPLAAIFAGGQGGRQAQRRRAQALAEQAAKDADAGGLQVQVQTGDGASGDDPEAAMQAFFAQFFADPYGWIDRNAARLTTTKTADDMAAVLLDDQPVLPPIGIPLKLDNDRWYFYLPTHLPGVSNFMPRTDEEWAIIGSVMRVLDQTVVELTADVKGGKIGTVKALADKAGEKTMMPAMIAFGAYMREMDVRQKRDRVGKQFSNRKKEWLKTAKSNAVGDSPAMPEKLEGAISTVSGPELDKLARKDHPPNLENTSDTQFAELLEGWFMAAGIKLTLAIPLKGPEIDAAVGTWEEHANQAKAAKAKRK